MALKWNMRQRRPHHVVGGAPPADADLAGQHLVVAVAEHAALRRAGRPAGVDEGGQVGGPHRRRGGSAPAAGRPSRARRSLARRRRPAPRRGRGPATSPATTGSARSTSDGSTSSTRGAGVGELVAQVLALVGGVDRDGDGAGQHACPTTASMASGEFSTSVATRSPGPTPRSMQQRRRQPARPLGHLGRGAAWCRRRRGTRRRGRTSRRACSRSTTVRSSSLIHPALMRPPSE